MSEDTTLSYYIQTPGYHARRTDFRGAMNNEAKFQNFDFDQLLPMHHPEEPQDTPSLRSRFLTSVGHFFDLGTFHFWAVPKHLGSAQIWNFGFSLIITPLVSQ